MEISSIAGMCLSIFIIFLVNVIIQIIRRNKDDDISYDIATYRFFLSPSIAFLILVILEIINKCV